METKLYRYKGCGLDNVYLQNGYTVSRLQSGDEVISIEDIERFALRYRNGSCGLCCGT